MAEASVSSAPLKDKNFTFIKKYLGDRAFNDFVTLSDWMAQSLGVTERELILQMDIEGGEYDVLILESSEVLSRFSAMVIEFHSLQKMFDPHFLQMITSIFEKLYANFSICHVHPNNCCGIRRKNGNEVQRVMEVTFLRKDLVERYRSNSAISLPNKMDRKNVSRKDDIEMPDPWWKI